MVIVLILFGVVLWYFRLIPLFWYWSSIPDNTLSGYRVALEAKPIAGIRKNASALTYNRDSDTLFTATNHPPQIFELSRSGDVVRRISVTGVDDLEGITHIEGHLYSLVDERRMQIHWVTIDADTKHVNVADAPRLGLNLLQNGNHGFEGVTWDKRHHRLFVAKEKPPLVLEIKDLTSTQGIDLQIHEWVPRQPFSRFMRDLSSLEHNEATHHMLLLSDESHLLVEYSAVDELAGIMPLWRGFHGLTANVPQAEGVAVGRNGTIYLISEPNLFYRFERQ